MPGDVLAVHTAIEASVATVDTAGNPAEADARHEYGVDVANPELSIALDPIAGDDVVNAAETAAGVMISGIVTGDYVEGDAVTLSVGDAMFDAVLDAGGRFEVQVDEAALAAARAVEATIATADAAGNPGAASASRDHAIDAEAPMVTLAVDPIGGDGTLDADEIEGAVAITGTVGGEFAAGDAVTLDVNGESFDGTVNVDGAWSIDVPGAILLQAVSRLPAAWAAPPEPAVCGFRVTVVMPNSRWC